MPVLGAERGRFLQPICGGAGMWCQQRLPVRHHPLGPPTSPLALRLPNVCSIPQPGPLPLSLQFLRLLWAMSIRILYECFGETFPPHCSWIIPPFSIYSVSRTRCSHHFRASARSYNQVPARRDKRNGALHTTKHGQSLEPARSGVQRPCW